MTEIGSLKIFSYKPKDVLTKVSRRTLFIVLAIIALVILAYFVMTKAKSGGINLGSSPTAPSTQQGENAVAVGKELNFPIYNQGEKTSNSLKMLVTTVERSEKILINGQVASARDGKDFLIIYIDITNPTNDKLNVRPVDFFRLVAADGSQFAADVHNDPVKAEPISIKKTRIGYVVDEQQTNFKFLIGEINGEKQEMEVNI